MNIDDLNQKATLNKNKEVIEELLHWYKFKIEPFGKDLKLLNADYSRNFTQFFETGVIPEFTYNRNDKLLNGRIFELLEELTLQFDEISPSSSKPAEEVDFEDQLKKVLRQKNYRLCEKLNKRGENVAVYRVIYDENEERVVKAILSSDFNKAEANVEMSLLSSGRTKNDYVVQVYEDNAEKYPYFIITQYAKGRSLRETLSVFDQIPFYMALEILIGISEGCRFLRKKGIKVANFNPEHILMTVDLTPLISPFKVFRTEQPTFSLEHFVAYAKYQSPERLCQEPDQLDAELLEKADMFSIALIGYELLTGKALFGGADIFEVISKRWKFFNTVPKDRPAFLDGIKGHPEVVELFSEMLSPVPAERPETLEELIDILKRLKPELSKEHRIALKSYQRCLENDQHDFIAQFYNKFFEEFSWPENIFADRAQQEQKLKSAIKVFLESSSGGTYIRKLPKLQGHKALNLNLKDYKRFVEIFIENLSEFDEFWDKKPEIQEAWKYLQSQFNAAMEKAIEGEKIN